MKNKFIRILFLVIGIISNDLHAQLKATASCEWAAGGGMYAKYVLDNDAQTYWSSKITLQQNKEAFIALDLKTMHHVTKVILKPRGHYGESICFPIDFEIQTSTDGKEWNVVPGQVYKDYPQPANNNTIDFFFQETLNTQYVRIRATKLRALQGGSNYMFQLAEFHIAESNVVVTASSEWAAAGGLRAAYVMDGDVGTYWASSNEGLENKVEWIALNLNESITIAKVTLTPRVHGTCFPVNFEIQTSTDGLKWTTVPGQTFLDYPKPLRNAPIDFKFQSTVNARHIRVFVTKTRDLNTDGNYMFHLAEFSVND